MKQTTQLFLDENNFLKLAQRFCVFFKINVQVVSFYLRSLLEFVRFQIFHTCFIALNFNFVEHCRDEIKITKNLFH